MSSGWGRQCEDYSQSTDEEDEQGQISHLVKVLQLVIQKTRIQTQAVPLQSLMYEALCNVAWWIEMSMYIKMDLTFCSCVSLTVLPAGHGSAPGIQ